MNYNHKSIKELADGLNNGKWSSVDIVKNCLLQIERNDVSGRKLNSIVELNPYILEEAKELDEERKKKGPRSLIHGIPVVIKDNICTKNMHTTAGSLALKDLKTAFDAESITSLKKAGALILGKSNLSEFAYFMSTQQMPSGYSSRGGQVVHPYCEGFDPSGSSSGSAVAVAARFVPVSIGTETNGSLSSPARNNGVVTIKPTLHLVSNQGVIPISIWQDCVGPMGKSVEDCAIVLSAMTQEDYLEDIGKAIKGMRIGLLHYENIPYNPRQEDILNTLSLWIEELQGESVQVEMKDEKINSFVCMQYEFKEGINTFLKEVNGFTAMKTLQDIITYNKNHADKCLVYGQDLLEKSEAITKRLTQKEYEKMRKEVTQKAQNSIDNLLKNNHLDCIITLYNTGHAPIAGYPLISIPAQEIEENNIDPISIVCWGKCL